MKNSTWWIIGGVISVIGGIIALLNPFAATIAANYIAAWIFLIVGILELVAIFVVSGGWNKVFYGLVGVLSVWLGITLLTNPTAGVLSLTFAVAVLLIAVGIFRFFFSFTSLRGTGGAFWMMILSSVISILLGVMILSNYPQSAAAILGIFLGVDLIFNGISMFSMSSISKDVETVTGID